MFGWAVELFASVVSAIIRKCGERCGNSPATLPHTRATPVESSLLTRTVTGETEMQFLLGL